MKTDPLSGQNKWQKNKYLVCSVVPLQYLKIFPPFFSTDFGLSNCASILGYSDPFSTQCGSPAYAAPELLARKKYGPKIDVWSM